MTRTQSTNGHNINSIEIAHPKKDANRDLEKESAQFARAVNEPSHLNIASNHNCKFGVNDKILAISVDDLDSHPSKMQQLTNYLSENKLPVTLFPHSGAKPENLHPPIEQPLNAEFGWHGTEANKLDPSPPAFVDQSVIAWSAGKDGETRKIQMKGDSGIIARGTHCDTEKRIGQFDQHDIPSCSLGSAYNATLDREQDKVLKNGGILSVHLHNSEGLDQLKTVVNDFKQKGGLIIHLSDLKGCGAPGK